MKSYLFLLLAAMPGLHASAQQRTISGTVTEAQTGAPLPGVTIRLQNSEIRTSSNQQGAFSLQAPAGAVTLQASLAGYHTVTRQVKAGERTVRLQLSKVKAPTVSYREATRKKMPAAPASYPMMVDISESRVIYTPPAYNTEDYSPVNENDFHAVSDQPLSTFSADVDRASYSNIRRFLNNGELPPADAVRIEEMINYFDYHYRSPAGSEPVAIYTDMAVCPWNTAHQLVRIGVKGREVSPAKLPASNLVFLLDVSGSMAAYNKLPLVKQAMKALVQQLRPADKVAIVVYAGAAGVVLPATSGAQKGAILDALEQLEAGGSTAGGEGLLLAYRTAAASFIKGGNNRVILATDGDFNVGPSSDGELQRLVEKERDRGIALSVLGFGMGNYKDNKLELLADKGNGNYAYIDNFEEARRTFVTEFGGTLFTIAKDVKLQVEFNPHYVQSYRLVGYENRLLQQEDFNNDRKDAGDMGAGHTVTALYEIVPACSPPTVNWVNPLKYQQRRITGNNSKEVLTVKLRYKQPGENTSRLLSQVLHYQRQDIKSAPEDFRMAAAVATFGLLLRNSEHKGTATYEQVLELAKGARGDDEEGYRAEFIQLVKKARVLGSTDQTSMRDGE